ncbi:MAG: metallophosphoesterase family protein [Bacteriovoracia bacterium]
MLKIILLTIFFVIIDGCKYKLSTYTAETPEQKLNEVHLSRIKEAETATGATFKIALISDTHNYYKELEKLIDVINSRGPYTFVIVSGDVTNLGLLEEYEKARDFLNKLKYPYLVAVGNHDLIANGDEIFPRMFGASDFKFTFKNIDFIFFDNNNWENSGATPDRAWIERQLLQSAAAEKILIAHVHPADRDRFTDQQIADFETMLNNFEVSYIINGHNHNPGEGVFGNASQITVGSPNKGSYFELLVTPGGITHQKIDF